MAAARDPKIEPEFIAGDWGTSHLRLFLCGGGAGTVLDTASGPGVVEARGRHATVFQALLDQWIPKSADLPAVLCGMVGSNIGWTEAPYLACPTKPAQIADACVALNKGRIHIIPGLSCRNRYQAPDFMRGEETQILGALCLEPALARHRQLLCLPGTHTKWVWLEEGAVREFLTSPVGEVFAVLADHSVLVRDRDSEPWVTGGAWFANGLQEFAKFPGVPLLHRLFECRSRRLNGEFESQQAAAYLSGLLIASDVSGALSAYPLSAASPCVHLIGAPQLTSLYATALDARGRATSSVDGMAASVAGLAHVQGLLSQRRTLHARR